MGLRSGPWPVLHGLREDHPGDLVDPEQPLGPGRASAAAGGAFAVDGGASDSCGGSPDVTLSSSQAHAPHEAHYAGLGQDRILDAFAAPPARHSPATTCWSLE